MHRFQIVRVLLPALALLLALPIACLAASEPTRPTEASQPVVTAQMPPLFGCPPTRVSATPPPGAASLITEWKPVHQRHNPEEVFGTSTTLLPGPTLTQWKNVTKRFPSMAPDEKLRVINGFFNNWSSIEDKANYGKEEHWASPAEFYAKGGGDCEDFAIIKYFALLWFGWPEKDLWLVFVKDLDRKTGHAVLAARTGDRIFILDNLSRPSYLIMPHMEYSRRFVPLFAFNELGIWEFPASEKAGAPAEGKKPEKARSTKGVTSTTPADNKGSTD